ncbi:MAG: hypothetical protein H3C64_05385 [Candidatus Kuenenia stuttgartiensis]|nr:hypothetical protein [Candidatus Kuenenia stuttgartiensis]
MRNVFISLNHPAHYHLFKTAVKILQSKGYETQYLISNKDVLEKVLIADGVPYIKLIEQGRRSKDWYSVLFKGGLDILKKDYLLYRVVKKYKPSILIGTDISITHVGKVLGIPSLFFNEDDYAINKLACILSYPFATKIVSPNICSVGKYEKKKIPYNGYQKIAYLHPTYFTPDYALISNLIGKDERYFIIRLVSLTAGHDVTGKHKGLEGDLVDKIIERLKPHGRIFITSEKKLDPKYERFALKIKPNLMHHLMAFATLFIADSQSMCLEAGLLGTPYIRYNDFVGKISVLNELENQYELGFGISPQYPDQLLNTLDRLMKMPDLKARWKEKTKKVFEDKIDVSSFFADTIISQINKQSNH